MKQELFVPFQPPGFNETIALAKGFGGKGFGYAKAKRENSDSVMLLARRLKPMKAAHVAFEWREPHKRRDPDNFSAGKKYVLDGLVAAGILPDDGWDEVLSLKDTWRVDKAHPGVLVVLTDD